MVVLAGFAVLILVLVDTTVERVRMPVEFQETAELVQPQQLELIIVFQTVFITISPIGHAIAMFVLQL